VEKLADRPEGIKPEDSAGFENLIPLKEILGEVVKTGPQSAKVDREYFRLLNEFGSELYILRELPTEEIKKSDLRMLAKALERMRSGKVDINPGFDGEYGKISLIGGKDFERSDQLTLF
ncbi:MAG: hypothetical protein HY746_08205, partial [Elusimicrobia bacterium]|nr:hypothetical protein [Elusimicrobiota bacterium]